MELKNLNTQLINWDKISPVITKGITGINTAHEYLNGGYKIRLSVYSANYESDHWCNKGHIIHCIEGRLVIKLKNGTEHILTAGKSLLLAENDSHAAVTGDEAAKIIIID